jgi:hypothetical protein
LSTSGANFANALGARIEDRADSEVGQLDAEQPKEGSERRRVGPGCTVLRLERDPGPVRSGGAEKSLRTALREPARCAAHEEIVGAVGAAYEVRPRDKTRTRLMLDLHLSDPRYGFDRHKGYATADHLAAVAEHGYSAVHRRSFRAHNLATSIGAGLTVPAPTED